MSATLVLACDDIVGESLIWSPEEAALYWVDIVGRRIHRFEPDGGRHDVWPTPEIVTSIGLRKDGGFIVGLSRQVALWQPDGAFETFAMPEPDLPGNRLNEGAVAPDGSFWVGTMADNIGADGRPKAMSGTTGSLYRIAADGAVARLTNDVFGITNTMCWMDDGCFVTADTLQNALYLYDAPSPTVLANRRPLGVVPDRGLPDGSTRDRAGLIYNARVAGGAAIARIDRRRGDVAHLALPCNSPTSCAFGGADLDTLFVTSSRFGMDAYDEREGGLFAIEGIGPGVACSRFG